MNGSVRGLLDGDGMALLVVDRAKKLADELWMRFLGTVRAKIPVNFRGALTWRRCLRETFVMTGLLTRRMTHLWTESINAKVAGRATSQM